MFNFPIFPPYSDLLLKIPKHLPIFPEISPRPWRRYFSRKLDLQRRQLFKIIAMRYWGMNPLASLHRSHTSLTGIDQCKLNVIFLRFQPLCPQKVIIIMSTRLKFDVRSFFPLGIPLQVLHHFLNMDWFRQFPWKTILKHGFMFPLLDQVGISRDPIDMNDLKFNGRNNFGVQLHRKRVDSVLVLVYHP